LIKPNVKWWAASGCCKKRMGLMSCLYTRWIQLGFRLRMEAFAW
jgi:hypothetical protein